MTDLAVLAEPGGLDEFPAPGEMVVASCAAALESIVDAIRTRDVDWLKRIRGDASIIDALVRERELGEEAHGATYEIILRSLRGLAQVVRALQPSGDIASPGGDRKSIKNAHGIFDPVRPLEVFGHERTRGDAYIMAEADDATFDEVVADLKKKHKLSRSAVVRGVRERVPAPPAAAPDQQIEAVGPVDKSREGVRQRVAEVRRLAASGHSTRQIALRLGIGERAVWSIAKREHIEIHADQVVNHTKRLDSNRIVSGTVDSLPGDSLFELIDYTALDGDRLHDWVASLDHSITSLTTLKRNLNKEMTRRAATQQ